MIEQLEKIDAEPIESLIALVNEKGVLTERLRLLDEQEGKVSQVVLDRVRGDYQNQYDAIEERALPLQEAARREFRKLEEIRETWEEALQSVVFDREELELRHQVGEFGDAEFGEKRDQLQEEIVKREEDLTAVQALRESFLSAFESEEDLLEEAPVRDEEAPEEAAEEDPEPQREDEENDFETGAEGESSEELPSEETDSKEEWESEASDPDGPSEFRAEEEEGPFSPDHEVLAPLDMPPPAEPSENPDLEGVYETQETIRRRLPIDGDEAQPDSPLSGLSVRPLPGESSEETADLDEEPGDDAEENSGGFRIADTNPSAEDVLPSIPVSAPQPDDVTSTAVLQRARLVPVEPIAGGREFSIEPITLIGRTKDNLIRIDEPAVSRRHAQISLTEDGYLLRDLGSENGSYVNGERMEQRLLNHGDRVQIGTVRFIFYEGE